MVPDNGDELSDGTWMADFRCRSSGKTDFQNPHEGYGQTGIICKESGRILLDGCDADVQAISIDSLIGALKNK